MAVERLLWPFAPYNQAAKSDTDVVLQAEMLTCQQSNEMTVPPGMSSSFEICPGTESSAALVWLRPQNMLTASLSQTSSLLT